MHGDAQKVASTKDWVSNPRDEWVLLVGIMSDLPLPLLLGKDWSGQRDPRPTRKSQCHHFPSCPAYLAHTKEDSADAGAEGELNSTANPLFCLSPGHPRRELPPQAEEDDRLRHCWGQVQLFKGEDQLSRHTLPLVYFLI